MQSREPEVKGSEEKGGAVWRSGARPWSQALALNPNFAPPDFVTEPLCATISPSETGDKNSIYFIGLNEFIFVKELVSSTMQPQPKCL